MAMRPGVVAGALFAVAGAALVLHGVDTESVTSASLGGFTFVLGLIVVAASLDDG